MVETDAIAERILTTYNTVTVVGASVMPTKAAYLVPAHMQQHGWQIIPINPLADVRWIRGVNRGMPSRRSSTSRSTSATPGLIGGWDPRQA